MNCLNKKTLEYQTLKKMSGISDFNLETIVLFYLEEYNRYPELDEIPDVNSSNYLKDLLDIKLEGDSINYTSIDKILEFTGTDNIQESNIIINNKFKDLEVKILPVAETAIINVKKRPSLYSHTDNPINVDINKDSNKSRAVILQALNKFQELYGINIIATNSDELSLKLWQNIVSDAKTANAFVYNGQIYINTDIANIDAPIHELMHIFLGGMRFTDPELYFKLIQGVELLPNIKDIAKIYRDRTKMDLLEEVFVTEFSKYLVGEKSYIDSLNKEDLNKIIYNVTRNLDTLLMGNYSVRGLELEELKNMSILELASQVESDITNPRTVDILNYADLHRRVANTKSDLLRSGKLLEICD